jgi:hypothetical protein
MLAQAHCDFFRGLETAEITNDQASPMETADTARMIAPRNPTGPSQFFRGQWGGLIRGDRPLKPGAALGFNSCRINFF